MQDLIRKRPGVIAYAGGLHRRRCGQCHLPQPRQPCRGDRDHFDPAVLSYRELLEFFFQIHDPSTPNRQGNDLWAVVSLGDLLPVGSAEGRWRWIRLPMSNAQRHVAGQGGDGTCAGRAVLAGGTRASGLSGAAADGLYLPLHPPELAPAAQGCRVTASPCNWCPARLAA